MGAKTKSPIGPELEKKIEGLEKDTAEVGWIDEDKIKKHGYPPSNDTKILVCGLPGVYGKFCLFFPSLIHVSIYATIYQYRVFFYLFNCLSKCTPETLQVLKSKTTLS